MPIRVIIADDHHLFREGLVTLLSESTDIEVVAEVENGKEAIEKSKELIPDIVIMDIGMPVLNGFEATIELLIELPKLKVIALSMHSDKQYIKGMLEAGASGYLFKNCSFKELIEAIHVVFSGNQYLSPQITETILTDYLKKKEMIPDVGPELTQRESEILKLISEGKQTGEISKMLFVSVKTISTHRQHLLEKLNLKTTADLVKYAIKKGIISL